VPVLSEVMVEGEGPRHMTSVEHGERDRVTQRPVFVGVPSQDLFGFLLLGRVRPASSTVISAPTMSGSSHSRLTVSFVSCEAALAMRRCTPVVELSAVPIAQATVGRVSSPASRTRKTQQ
jgi:hypothetical protein